MRKNGGFSVHLPFNEYVLWFLSCFRVLRQWTAVSQTCRKRFSSSVLTIWIWMGVSHAAQRVAVHGRPLRQLQNSGKPELCRGRAGVQIHPPTCSSPTNSAFLPQLPISSVIFYEIETLWVT